MSQDIFNVLKELNIGINLLYCLDSRDDQLSRHQTLNSLTVYLRKLEEFIREELLYGYSEPNDDENEIHGYNLKHKSDSEKILFDKINKTLEKEVLSESIFSQLKDKV